MILDPATMKRFVGDDETLRKFRNKDVVVVIDPLRMEVMATEVAQ